MKQGAGRPKDLEDLQNLLDWQPGGQSGLR